MTDSPWKDETTRRQGLPPVVVLESCMLRFPDGTKRGFRHRSFRLGLAPDNDVQLDSDSVSRRHAEIERLAAGYLIRDLDSTNGTRINGVRVREAWLAHGDRVSIGDVSLVFELEENLVLEDLCPKDPLSMALGTLREAGPTEHRAAFQPYKEAKRQLIDAFEAGVHLIEQG